MRTRRPRILIRQDGHDLAFCHVKFRTALSRYIDKRRDEGVRITQTELCQKLANHLNLSQDSIDNYRKGYNGPASIEVVKDMAGYMKVEWTELMKEVTPMADKKTDMEMAEKKMLEADKRAEEKAEEKTMPIYVNTNPLTEFEKMSAWTAVRDVYKAMCVLVSFFEGDHSVVLDLKDSSSDPIIRSYNYCLKVLHRNMLDIPDETYEKLYNLIFELQFWIYGLPRLVKGEYDDIDDETYSAEYFGKLHYLELNEEFNTDFDEWAENVTSWVVDDFYHAVRKILKSFIPRESAEGMGCPQNNPVNEVE